jgi:hypothetical protein
MHRPYLERLIDFAAERGGDEALREARRLFFAATGEVSEDDPSFELRLGSFIEWYALEYRPSPDEMTWAERWIDEVSREEQWLAAQLAASHRSLFVIKRLRPKELWLSDLLGGGRFLILGEPPVGLQKNDIFEGRAIPWGERLTLSPTVLFHPSEAREMILRQVAKAKATHEARPVLLARLARMRLRMERYRKIPIEKIYNPEAIFGR